MVAKTAKSKVKKSPKKTAPKAGTGKVRKKTAKKTTKKTAKKTTKKKTAKKPLDEEALREVAIATAFARTAEHGWEAVRLDEVAVEIGVSPLQLRGLYGRADDILYDFMERTDETLASAPPADGVPVREALLELLMRRLDAYEPHRDGICRLWQDLRKDPRLGLRLSPKFYGSFAKTLRLAGANDETAYIFGFAAVHMAVLNVWCSDQDPSRNRTLAAADKYLGWAERLARLCD